MMLTPTARFTRKDRRPFEFLKDSLIPGLHISQAKGAW